MSYRDPTMHFFETDRCDRCHGPMDVRTMSWFNTDAICMDCANDEDELKDEMREHDMDPAQYEGCGYVPDLDDYSFG